MATAAEQLSEEYRRLNPALEKVYVIPDIARVSAQNSYLFLLYREFLEGSIPGVLLESFSFLHPRIVWRRLRGEQSLLHHHWFEFHNLRTFLNVLWKLFWLSLYRLAGGKIVWTIHNRQPHQGNHPALNRRLRRLWALLPHKVHLHCPSAGRIVGPELGIAAEKFFVVAHPPYPARLLSREEARRQLQSAYPEIGLPESAPLLMMFGYIARYKGILATVELFRQLEGRGCLLIAGPVKWGNTEYGVALRQSAAEDPRIVLIDRYIPENQVPLFLNSADYLVFNYEDILNSGGVVLAQSYRKPVIVPDMGCLQELSGEDVHKFSDQAGLRRILQGLLSPA